MKYTMWQQSKDLVRLFKRELRIYQSVLADSRTPVQAKIFLGLAVGYLCMPFDLIPDFIPVIGHLDDAIIVPALIFCCPSLSAARNRFRAPRAGRPRASSHRLTLPPLFPPARPQPESSFSCSCEHI